MMKKRFQVFGLEGRLFQANIEELENIGDDTKSGNNDDSESNNDSSSGSSSGSKNGSSSGSKNDSKNSWYSNPFQKKVHPIKIYCNFIAIIFSYDIYRHKPIFKTFLN